MESQGKKRTQLGGSLPVPNVQSLAASCHSASSVPGRYIRPELAAAAAAAAAAADVPDQLPVIDLGTLLLGENSASARDEATKLRSACEEWGFFHLVNHGVAEEAIESMKAAMEGFFSQPLEDKLASSAQPPDSIEGYGQAFVVSEEQKLDWGDMLFLFTQPPSARNTNLWPTHPPTFRAAMERYSSEVKKVALALLVQMGRELGLHAERVAELFEDCVQSLRMNYYPPCRHRAGELLGISPHSDATGLTVLLQVSPVQGLQVRRGGRWVPVSPLPGGLVVNVGDVLESYYGVCGGGGGGGHHHQFSPYYAAAATASATVTASASATATATAAELGVFPNFYPYYAQYAQGGGHGGGLQYPQMLQYPYGPQSFGAGILSLPGSVAASTAGVMPAPVGPGPSQPPGMAAEQKSLA